MCGLVIDVKILETQPRGVEIIQATLASIARKKERVIVGQWYECAMIVLKGFGAMSAFRWGMINTSGGHIASDRYRSRTAAQSGNIVEEILSCPLLTSGRDRRSSWLGLGVGEETAQSGEWKENQVLPIHVNGTYGSTCVVGPPMAADLSRVYPEMVMKVTLFSYGLIQLFQEYLELQVDKPIGEQLPLGMRRAYAPAEILHWAEVSLANRDGSKGVLGTIDLLEVDLQSWDICTILPGTGRQFQSLRSCQCISWSF